MDIQQPQQRGSRGWRIAFWIAGGILVLVVVLVAVIGPGRVWFFDLFSERIVVVHVGPGGFNNPYQAVYWKNGAGAHLPGQGEIPLYTYRRSDQTAVLRFESALASIDVTALRRTPCSVVVLDAPDKTYELPRLHKIVDLSAAEWECYRADPAVQTASDIEQAL